MKQTAITTVQNPAELAHLNGVMKQAGRAANKAAANNVFKSDISGQAKNTERRKRADLALFETFLQSVNIPARDLFDNPQAWTGVTWGIVEGFKVWMMGEGYALASVNARLSTVRHHAGLAVKAGTVSETEGRMIESVNGYARKDYKHMDDRRRADGMQTRKGAKKSEAVRIPEDIARALTTQPNTPQGKRDALLMCLLLEHGLRVGEVAILTRAAFDLKAGTFTFYRPKVDKLQTHEMTPATRNAAKAYLRYAPEIGIIWRRSCKGTSKLSSQMSETSATRALTKRVEFLGQQHGIDGLSAHDCRHYDATFEARQGVSIEKIVSKFGWNSPAMAFRYIEAARISNDGSARLVRSA